MGQDVIHVMLVDDDEQIQQALRTAIETHPELKLLGQAYTLKEAMQAVSKLKPDVVLVDLGLPDGSGLELIAHIHQNMPNCESMVLTVFGDESHVISSIEAGATGYLTKDTRTAEILDRLKQLRAGGSPISPLIARQLLFKIQHEKVTENNLLQAKADLDETRKACSITDRELTVIQQVARGFTAQEIAGQMGISTHTVATHVKRIYRKLHVHSRSEAVYEATMLGLLNL